MHSIRISFFRTARFTQKDGHINRVRTKVRQARGGVLHPKTLNSQQVTSGNVASAYLALCMSVDIYMPLSTTIPKSLKFFGGSEPDGKIKHYFLTFYSN